LAPPVVVALVAVLAAALELPRDVVVLVVQARRPLAAAVVLRELAAALPSDRLLSPTTLLLRVPLLAALLVAVALLAVLALKAVEEVVRVAQLLLLSRQSFSAAMARSSPIPLLPTYKLGRSSR